VLLDDLHLAVRVSGDHRRVVGVDEVVLNVEVLDGLVVGDCVVLGAVSSPEYHQSV
jgi:hypothetical protein